MNQLIFGKALETAGALFLAYVGVRAAAIELFIVGPIRSGKAGHGGVFHDVAKRLEAVAEARRREFGPYEACIVALGTLCVALGCLWYLGALMVERP